ncbi:MAG: hypothetical protein QOK07_3390 [Gemmatimonadaceae bacterium]|jgi:hypothetical protein|nr:hypothetical protein [Gemmatimonadaceae bacterium]
MPRWNAVIAHIVNDEPHEQIRAELFNAGALDGWSDQFASPAVAHLVTALVAAHEGLADQLRQVDRPEAAIENAVASARQEALRLDGAPALAVAERALIRTLIGTAREGIALGASTPDQAAQAWENNRGTPASLVGRFLGEVLHQFTCHVVARDAGQIVGRGSFANARAVRQLEQSLAAQAREVSSAVDVSGAARDLPQRWSSLIHDAFRTAATPPHANDG